MRAFPFLGSMSFSDAKSHSHGTLLGFGDESRASTVLSIAGFYNPPSTHHTKTHLLLLFETYLLFLPPSPPPPHYLSQSPKDTRGTKFNSFLIYWRKQAKGRERGSSGGWRGSWGGKTGPGTAHLAAGAVFSKLIKPLKKFIRLVPAVLTRGVSCS